MECPVFKFAKVQNVSAHKKTILPAPIGKYKLGQMLNNLLHLYGY